MDTTLGGGAQAQMPGPTAPTHTDSAGKKRIPFYYERLGLGCDALLRCKDCRTLVVREELGRRGVTPCCGTKRVTEITTLTLWEWIKVRTGLIDFPYRKEFLAEFSRVRS